MAWETRAVCPNCGWHCYCAFGESFHAMHNGSHVAICPQCAEPNSSSWAVEPMRWINTATFWKPWTWSSGFWESKKVLDILGVKNES